MRGIRTQLGSPAQTYFPTWSHTAVDLSQGDYMGAITAATADLRINLVFNNAGYIKPGLFVENTLDVYVIPGGSAFYDGTGSALTRSRHLRLA